MSWPLALILAVVAAVAGFIGALALATSWCPYSDADVALLIGVAASPAAFTACAVYLALPGRALWLRLVASLLVLTGVGTFSLFVVSFVNFGTCWDANL